MVESRAEALIPIGSRLQQPARVADLLQVTFSMSRRAAASIVVFVLLLVGAAVVLPGWVHARDVRSYDNLRQTVQRLPLAAGQANDATSTSCPVGRTDRCIVSKVAAAALFGSLVLTLDRLGVGSISQDCHARPGRTVLDCTGRASQGGAVLVLTVSDAWLLPGRAHARSAAAFVVTAPGHETPPGDGAEPAVPVTLAKARIMPAGWVVRDTCHAATPGSCRNVLATVLPGKAVKTAPAARAALIRQVLAAGYVVENHDCRPRVQQRGNQCTLVASRRVTAATAALRLTATVLDDGRGHVSMKATFGY